MSFDKLSAPFRPEQIHWRVGATNADKTKGMALAYIDARDVQDRLDETVGPTLWQCRYPHANGKTVCEIGIMCVTPQGYEWIWKADGAGDSDVEAEKGALSDAFKRAAVRWGIGRYLYDLESPWVEVEQKGRSVVIKQAEYKRLRQVAANAGGAQSRAPEPSNEPETGNQGEYIERCLRYIDKEAKLPNLKAWWERENSKIKALGAPDYYQVYEAFLAKGKKLAASSIVEAA
jgi:hypothetical protein